MLNNIVTNETVREWSNVSTTIMKLDRKLVKKKKRKKNVIQQVHVAAGCWA